MNTREASRLDILCGDSRATPEFLSDYYDVGWPWSGEIQQDFHAWLERSPWLKRWEEISPSRIVLEAFWRDQRIEPKKWTACQLGMKESSFDRVLEALPRIGLRRHRYEVAPHLISTSFGKDLDAHLPQMKFRTFGSHNPYCEFLHADLQRELEVEIEAEWCATSLALAADPAGSPRQYARNFDCVTFDPLSVRHQMFLDFGKPLYLQPDVCSKLLYVRERSILEPYHAGSTEPRDLFEYEVVPHV